MAELEQQDDNVVEDLALNGKNGKKAKGAKGKS